MAGPGPMHSTASDFWKMMWEKKSYVIVMLGCLKEHKEVYNSYISGQWLPDCFIRKFVISIGQA